MLNKTNKKYLVLFFHGFVFSLCVVSSINMFQEFPPPGFDKTNSLLNLSEVRAETSGDNNAP